MPKLRWNWLDRYSNVYTDHAFRATVGGMVSIFPLIVGLFATFGGGPLGVGITFLSLLIPLWTWVAVAPLIPRLHYLYGLEYHSRAAIKWYEDLTDQEKAQLPVGWDAVVRECGGEYYGNIYLATKMHRDGRDVVALYRKKNEALKVPDHRIELYLDLMSQRTKELNQDIYERAEIERQIASMP